jgi:pyrimidine operon attenuation protein / uracil phosphoribosyltransferase
VEKIVLDAEDVRRTLARISHEIVEQTGGRHLALVGVHRRGAVLARRLRDRLEELCEAPPPLGDVDISFYRDDVGLRSPSRQPVVHASHVDFSLERRTVVLVDDVLYTGRSVRAALDALRDVGRPNAVQLAVLVDRGHRELPLRADYVGKNVPTSRSENVKVRLAETDEVEGIWIAPHGGPQR